MNILEHISHEKFRKYLLFIAVCGFIVHFIPALFTTIEPQSDALDYHQLAVNIAEHHAYEIQGHATAYRPIGFPAVLGAVYSISPNVMLGQILQSILIAVSGLLIALIIVHASQSYRLGVIGAVLWNILPITFAQSLVLMSEPLAITTMLAGIYFWMIANNKKYVLLAGICLGISILTRPTFVFVIPAFFIVREKHSDNISLLKKGAILIAGIMIAISPWLIRNYNVMGKAMLSTNGGINAFIGNNPEANGSYKVVKLMHTFDGMHEVPADKFAMHLSVQYMLEHPVQTLTMIPKKIAYLFSSDAYVSLELFAKADTNYRAMIQSLSLWQLFLFIIPGAGVFLGGLLTLPLIKEQYIGKIIIACMILWMAAHALFFGSPRYHEPLIPFMIIAIVLGLNSLKTRWSSSLLLLPIFQIAVYAAELTVYFIKH